MVEWIGWNQKCIIELDENRWIAQHIDVGNKEVYHEFCTKSMKTYTPLFCKKNKVFEEER